MIHSLKREGVTEIDSTVNGQYVDKHGKTLVALEALGNEARNLVACIVVLKAIYYIGGLRSFRVF